MRDFGWAFHKGEKGHVGEGSLGAAGAGAWCLFAARGQQIDGTQEPSNEATK